MQEATIALIMAVASILGAVGMGARLLLNRMKRMEKEDELRRAAEQKELKVLRERVADLEAKAKRVPILENQVCTLLTEMSTLQQKVREVSDELAVERDNKARLERELTDTRAERDQLRIEKRDWETARATYDHALTLLGLEREGYVKSPGDGTQPPTPPRARRKRSTSGTRAALAETDTKAQNEGG